MKLWERLERDGFEDLILLANPRIGLRAVLAVHDTSGVPAFGGIRRASYADEEAVHEDALRLARAMSRKCSLASLPAGGAKMVLWDRPDLDVPAAYRAIGELLERLGGRWFAGPDVGTGWDELDQVARKTRFVTRRAPEGPGRLGEATATGVLAGIRAALESLDGESNLSGRHVVLQGLGAVGRELAKRLLAEGARVTACDPRQESLEPFLAEPDFQAVPVGAEMEIPCDVFAPCALGGVLDEATIARLEARVVCGAANHPCRDAEDPERLHARGVLLVPDIVVTAGAVMRGLEHALDGRATPLEEIEERIGGVAREILAHAAAQGLSPQVVAQEEADRRLLQRREAHWTCDRPSAFVSEEGS